MGGTHKVGLKKIYVSLTDLEFIKKKITNYDDTAVCKKVVTKFTKNVSLPWSQVYKLSTWERRLLLQTFVKGWVALGCSVIL